MLVIKTRIPIIGHIQLAAAYAAASIGLFYILGETIKNIQSSNLGRIKQIVELHQLLNILASNHVPLVLDIRPRANYNSGHIFNAIHIDERSAVLPRRGSVVVYGQNSREFLDSWVDTLKREAPEVSVFEYRAGWEEWVSCGLDRLAHTGFVK